MRAIAAYPQGMLLEVTLPYYKIIYLGYQVVSVSILEYKYNLDITQCKGSFSGC